MSATGLLGPGTLVRDALAYELLDATVTGANDGAHTAVLVSRPGRVAVFLETGSVTGSTPTLDVELQGADNSAFSEGVVSYGAFPQIGDEDNAEYVLEATVFKPYMRVVTAAGGSNPSFPVVITVRTQHDRRNEDRTAGATS